MIFSPAIDELIQALRCLPSVGPKSAQRMAFHLLERGRESGAHLAQCLESALREVGHCEQCHTFCENQRCQICASPKRDTSLLCVVESPIDVLAVEQTGSYSGLYFVLMGHLSPIDGIGPEQLRLDRLQKRLENESIKEIILATNPTVEGEATAHYIAQMVKNFDIRASRIAHGVPLGGELEYIDGGTLSRALLSRDLVT